MKKIAVILSGCGFKDGSEIHESVLTLLALKKYELNYQCMAPNIEQTQVINHLSGAVENEKRMVLEESSRIARGDIIDIKKANPDDYAGMIFPGGYGAAGNLSDFSTKGIDYSVNKDVLEFAKKIAQANKPSAFICIAPTLVPAIFDKGVKVTIGTDRTIASQLEQLGCIHIDCGAEDIVVDKKHKVITTPAYMLAKSIKELATGLAKTAEAISELI